VLRVAAQPLHDLAGRPGVEHGLAGRDRAQGTNPVGTADLAARFRRGCHEISLTTSGFVSRLADDLPQVAELDLNPVIARPDGVSAVDARVRITPAEPQDPFLRRLR